MIPIILPFVAISLVGIAVFSSSVAAQGNRGTSTTQNTNAGRSAQGFKFEVCSIRLRDSPEAGMGGPGYSLGGFREALPVREMVFLAYAPPQEDRKIVRI